MVQQQKEKQGKSKKNKEKNHGIDGVTRLADGVTTQRGQLAFEN